MLKYIFKRLLIIIPTLWVIASITFALSLITKVDPIESLLTRMGIVLEDLEYESYKLEYKSLAKKHNKDLPYFYLSFHPENYPVTLNTLTSSAHKALARNWLNRGYKWESIVDKINTTPDAIKSDVLGLEKYPGYPLPILRYHGTSNQYHIWICQLFAGNLGTSLRDGRNVSQIILEALPWTMTMTMLAMILSGVISIFAGSRLSSRKYSQWDKAITTLLYVIYSIPIFWLGTLLVIFCTTDEYGSWLHWFPSVGIKIGYFDNVFVRIYHSLKHLLLPVFCLAIHSLAFDFMQVKTSMKNQYSMEYVYTALAKGLSDQRIRSNHVFKNAMLPIITLLVSSLPATVAGSIVIETIFNIPGMGRLLMSSIYQGDWNVVYGILILSAFITLISYLLGDVLYKYSDPKIKLDEI